MTSDHRRAPRLVVNAPAVVESIGQTMMQLHPNLAKVFRRVDADTTSLGKKHPCVVRDLSTNGAFVSGMTLPLLARVALRLDVRGIGPIDAIGWVLWQRTADCELPGEERATKLPKGFGVLFEAIPLHTRAAIAALVAQASE
jgi:hypothetical protein